MRVEIGSQVHDDSVGEAKSVQDVANQANHSICIELCDWLLLDLLRKLVDGHQHVSKTSWRSCQGPYHVQALACKRP
jgi:lactate dehydrogenase-like 2-hydroxyacid dehydrogenase